MPGQLSRNGKGTFAEVARVRSSFSMDGSCMIVTGSLCTERHRTMFTCKLSAAGSVNFLLVSRPQVQVTVQFILLWPCLWRRVSFRWRPMTRFAAEWLFRLIAGRANVGARHPRRECAVVSLLHMAPQFARDFERAPAKLTREVATVGVNVRNVGLELWVGLKRPVALVAEDRYCWRVKAHVCPQICLPPKYYVTRRAWKLMRLRTWLVILLNCPTPETTTRSALENFFNQQQRQQSQFEPIHTYIYLSQAAGPIKRRQ